ncbi:Predicted thiol-disulfide oxidoreductase YuxK, DCC family [Luteibacter sp. UNCMF331Sha3.1]|jgi:predicted DCC family thiol-disulfide oxidoreductase YuxK|uniref:thiol-disulfide oxidoreductase DCC family protein n=1 Tax=Luteibacter sp. UNCMF331Sha3.1 TaxID=1502760 RepID=UPI0008ACDAC4|nr:DCC1-like thiol-disulfide oxidoreductase family protein [Luteibacter sp. UNCMF331Sha3.1]SEN15484.1 Predicted thiol-disulfide oxidoreductase YuxK, DCC family [Luteibacter sp. UNCMF331Sha3.1]
MTAPEGPIILFDAECVLCSANAWFVLKRDRRARFRLASMQEPAGAALCEAHGVDPSRPDTMLVIDGASVWRDSDAVIAVCAGLGFPWRALTVLRYLPRSLRDPPYRWVARHRYRLFGRRATCWIPPAGYRDRLL